MNPSSRAARLASSPVSSSAGSKRIAPSSMPSTHPKYSPSVMPEGWDDGPGSATEVAGVARPPQPLSTTAAKNRAPTDLPDMADTSRPGRPEGHLPRRGRIGRVSTASTSGQDSSPYASPRRYHSGPGPDRRREMGRRARGGRRDAELRQTSIRDGGGARRHDRA